MVFVLSVEELLEEAEAAKDVAAGMFPFLNHVPQSSAEITGVMSELFAISSVLRELSTGLRSRRCHNRIPSIVDGLNLVVPTLSTMLDDILHMFERLGITPARGVQAYTRVWREIQRMATIQGAPASLLQRLEICRVFLVELLGVLRGARPGHCDMRLLRRQIESMKAQHDSPLEDDFANLSTGPPVDPRQRKPPPSSMYPEPSSPRQVPMHGAGFHGFAPPPAPEVPPSVSEVPPLASPSATTFSSTSSNNTNSHWALKVFDGSQSITPFSTRGIASSCTAPDTGENGQIIPYGHNKVVDMEFDGGAVAVHVYYNPLEHRARILCLSNRKRAVYQARSWSELSLLHISRAECCLHLSHARRTSRTRVLWATLRFSSYERLVLFFCTCAALRSQAPPDVPFSSEEYKIQGETELHVCKIEDDNFQHVLRIFKDKDSGGVRLEAAVLRGEMKRMPVWTTFSTEAVPLIFNLLCADTSHA
ncbi:MAG: hypothetical protein M1825_002243 [Sarcosagium campestre]|nr:MAG: hypothetical protein M1825_002243 [Sarcosagium campestre]